MTRRGTTQLHDPDPMKRQPMTTPPDLHTCATCTHFRPKYPGEPEHNGTCHCRSPTIMSGRVFGETTYIENYERGVWPRVDHTESCGEWQWKGVEGDSSS